ncbi:MAG TPA: phosphate ABC transporter permease PstA [Caulobacter sp.]|nr:phosphate ABC transporter permease PstA [Caulobacter sp.]
MTDAPRDISERRLRRRHAAEARFRLYGQLAIVIALGFLVVLLARVVQQGYSVFWTHSITTSVYLDPARIDRTDLEGVNFDYLAAQNLLRRLKVQDDDLGLASGEAMDLVSRDLGYRILDAIKKDPSVIGKTLTFTVPVKANADLYYKGQIERATPASDRKLTDRQLDWLDRLKAEGVVRSHFNADFFTRSDSTEPEQAGVLGAVVGSALMLLVAALIAVPIGVLAAVWLEEFAPRGRISGFIEVNINNLAAVPSIVYGLLGLVLFINWLGFPRSAPLTGGMVLALMSLPTIIIATRAALKAVPPSIREAALGMGASRNQTVFHHVLPQAAPGVMTGIILSMAHALGETAPLLMIGMVAFTPGLPESLASAASVLPVQVFIWENAAEAAFHERTAGAIIVLLVFMILMNATAVILRRRFEKRW